MKYYKPSRRHFREHSRLSHLRLNGTAVGLILVTKDDSAGIPSKLTLYYEGSVTLVERHSLLHDMIEEDIKQKKFEEASEAEALAILL